MVPRARWLAPHPTGKATHIADWQTHSYSRLAKLLIHPTGKATHTADWQSYSYGRAVITCSVSSQVPIEPRVGGGLRAGAGDSSVRADAVPSFSYVPGAHISLLVGSRQKEFLADAMVLSASGLGSRHIVLYQEEQVDELHITKPTKQN